MKFLLKIILASGILYWLFSNGKLDLNLMVEIFKFPELMIISAILCVFQILLCSYRWGILLRMKAPELSTQKILSIQWIGQLFSSILPGAVTGDLIKVGHLKKETTTLSKTYLLFTILLDRIIGLSALLCISAVSGLIFYSELVKLNPVFKEIIALNILLFVGSLFFLGLFFIKTIHQTFILRLVKIEKVKAILQSLWEMGLYKKKFLQMFSLSLLAHTCAILSLYFINKHFFNPNFEFKYLFAIVPMGQVSVAIPISPGGLGVGHIIFERLFSFLHQDHGASLFNLAWITAFSVNLLGLLPSLFSKNQTAQNEKRPIAFFKRWAFFKS